MAEYCAQSIIGEPCTGRGKNSAQIIEGATPAARAGHKSAGGNAPEPLGLGNSGPSAFGAGALQFVQFSRETNASAAAKESAERTLPPVEIKVDREGRLIITSEDTEALDSIEELAAQSRRPAGVTRFTN